MQNQTQYNGWKNYLTWLTNLYFNDFVDDLLYHDAEIVALMDDDANFDEVYEIVKSQLMSAVEDALHMPPWNVGFLSDVLHCAVMQEICFFEIVSTHINDAYEYRARVTNDENLPQ